MRATGEADTFGGAPGSMAGAEELDTVKSHYHVMTGMVGCLPDSNEVYDTKGPAALAVYAEIEDHMDQCPEHRMMARDAVKYGTAYCNGEHCIHIVELALCSDVDCEIGDAS